MKGYTLDKIVRQALAARGYSMHFYLQFLTYGVDALRELNFDVLQSVKSARLPVNSYKAAPIPCDYVDFIRIGNELGQYIDPWAENQGFNRLNKFDANGAKIPFPNVEGNNEYIPSFVDGTGIGNYANSRGEMLGRVFNARPSFKHSFLIVRERDEIQLDTDYSGLEITLDYITDGTSIDASNAIHPYAIEAIKSYIFWKMKENGRHYGIQERREAKDEFYNQLRILKGRMNSMGANDVIRSLAKYYGPTVKN